MVLRHVLLLITHGTPPALPVRFSGGYCIKKPGICPLMTYFLLFNAIMFKIIMGQMPGGTLG